MTVERKRPRSTRRRASTVDPLAILGDIAADTTATAATRLAAVRTLLRERRRAGEDLTSRAKQMLRDEDSDD